MWDFVANLIAGLALLGAFFAWRAAQLRREEVLEWGLRCIDQMQRLNLLSSATDGHTDEITRLSTEISVLVEQGRIYFKNANPEQYGIEKESAYRGFRPAILDQLVFTYEISSHWAELDDGDRFEGHKVIAKCEQRFVSLLQREIGRKRTADRYNMEGGSGHKLRSLLALSRSNRFSNLPTEKNEFIHQIIRHLRM